MIRRPVVDTGISVTRQVNTIMRAQSYDPELEAVLSEGTHKRKDSLRPDDALIVGRGRSVADDTRRPGPR